MLRLQEDSCQARERYVVCIGLVGALQLLAILTLQRIWLCATSGLALAAD